MITKLMISALLVASVPTTIPFEMTGVYDGDTYYINIAILPPPLNRMSIRLLGIDTPELRRSKCSEEKDAGYAARQFVVKKFSEAGTVELGNLKWGKYGGRILADVYLDGEDLAGMLVAEGHAISYFGGKKQDWCKILKERANN